MMRRFNLMLTILFSSLLFCSSQAWSLNRFADLNDGTMLDTSSSLRWLKNANCFGQQNWYSAMSSATALASSSCGLTDGSTAGDWHLPTLAELRSLTNTGDRYDTLNAAGFSSVQPNPYYSSSSNLNYNSYAWYYNMSTGFFDYYTKSSDNAYVWPVRNEHYWIQGSLAGGGKTDFGTQLLNSTSSELLTLINSGSSQLAITGITISGSNANQFSLALDGASACSGLTPALAASAKCTITIQAKPTSSGSKTATLTIATAAGNKDLTLTVTGYAFNVIYHGNGNTSGNSPSDNTNYASGAAVTVLGNSGALAKSGYGFNGWNSSADGSGTNYAPGSTFNITSSTDLYAKWTPALPVLSGLVGWWRGEGDAVDSTGWNAGTPHLQTAGTALIEKIAPENATATATCDSGETIQSYSSTYGAGSNTISCGSCTVGANSCSVTYSNAICTDPAGGMAKSGTLSLTCTVSTGAFPPGKVGQAIRFNGSSDYVSQGKTYKGIASSSSNSSFTTEFWAKPTATITNLPTSQTTSGTIGASGQRYAIFPEQITGSTTEAGAGISVGINGIVVTEYADSYLPAPLVYPLAAGDVSAEGWLHIAVVYESQTPKLYVNGVLKQTGLSSGKTVYPSSAFGERGLGYGYYSGLLDEVHIFNHALTPTEIQNIYNSGSVGLNTAQVSQVINFGAAPTIAVGGNGAVSATSSSGFPITLSSLTPATCSISNSIVNGIREGLCSIAANQPAMGIYTQAAQVTQDITIIAATAPTVATAAATAITTTSATLNATVNANYSSDVVSFEYGTTTAYGSTATVSQSPVSGGTVVSVSAALSGLEFNTAYHYRVKAVNAVTGTVYGNDMFFVTPIRRFIDLTDGTMLDTTNSLRWLKKADCLGAASFSQSKTKSAALASNACGLTDGSKAGDWHVPTISELASLVAAPDNYRTVSFNAAGFSGVATGNYWSSTDYGNGSAGYYYIVSMFDGMTRVDYDKGYQLWPVRNGTFVYSGLNASPATIDFGTLLINASASHDITISNSGTYSHLVISSITPGGSDSSQFSVGSGTCGTAPITLAPGASCTLPVSIKLTSAGSKSAKLTVVSTAGSKDVLLTATGSAPLSVTYNGNGNSAGAAPTDSSSPYASGATVTVRGNTGSLVKTGYTFAGWNTAADGSGAGYQSGATFTISADTVLYAKWAAAVASPSGLISWWRGEGNVVDSVGGNTGTSHLGTGIVTATAAENATATATCDSGETIVSYSSTYGAGSQTISCGSCTVGANSCSVTYSNANCTDPAIGSVKSGTLSLTCTVSTDAFPAGKVGQNIRFNGSSDHVTQGKTYKGVASSSANSSFTMEFWAKPTATITNLAASQTTSGYAGTSGQRYAIFPEMQDSTTEAGAGVSVGTNGIMVTEHAGDYLPAPLVYPLVDGDMPSDGWLHIAVVYESQTPKLYVNGVLKQTGLNSGRTVYPSSQFGGTSYGFYSGLLDEVHIFNHALTVTEIQNIFNAGSGGVILLPAITGITPSTGSSLGGTTVSITGTALTGVSAVTFGTTAATGVNGISDTQISAVSPAGVVGHIADITVTTPSGTSAVSSADQFTYTQDQARNISTGAYYALLADAITNALSGAEIRAYDSQFDGTFTLDKGVTLKGGYNAAFDAKSGNPTILNGGLTIQSGASSVETLVVKGQLVLQAGSLRVNDVTVRP